LINGETLPMTAVIEFAKTHLLEAIRENEDMGLEELLTTRLTEKQKEEWEKLKETNDRENKEIELLRSF
jgi:hypothetical protein